MATEKKPEKVDTEGLLKVLRKSPCCYDDTQWAAYRNVAMDSATFGHLQYLAVGPQNTHKEKPRELPVPCGWKYRFEGWVDMETGEVYEQEGRRGGSDAEGDG